MTEVKTLQEKVEGKLRILDLTVENTARILKAEDVKAIKIERHGSALRVHYRQNASA